MVLLAPAVVAPHDLVGDLGILKGYLRDENHIGAACKPAVERDPARMASHHFEHHDALVAGGCRVQSVQRVRHAGDSGVEAKRHRGGFEIVVDSLGHADDGDALFVQLQRGGKGSVAPDRDESGEPELIESLLGLVDDFLRNHRPLSGGDLGHKMTAVCRSENGSAKMHDSGGNSCGRGS